MSASLVSPLAIAFCASARSLWTPTAPFWLYGIGGTSPNACSDASKLPAIAAPKNAWRHHLLELNAMSWLTYFPNDDRQILAHKAAKSLLVPHIAVGPSTVGARTASLSVIVYYNRGRLLNKTH